MKKLFTLMVFILSLQNVLAKNCERNQLLSDYKASPEQIVGIGESNHKDKTQAKQEAKSRAFLDIGSQLRSNVDSSMSLDETDKATQYQMQVNITTKLTDVDGIKFLKEASDGKTVCVAYVFNVKNAYKTAESYAKVIETKIQDVLQAAKDRKYSDVIRMYKVAKDNIRENEDLLIRADIYKTYLKKAGQSHWEKVKTNELIIDKAFDEAKKTVVFYVPEFKDFPEVQIDVENFLNEKGFATKVEKGKLKDGFEIKLKTTGNPKKTESALGYTLVYNFSITIKELNNDRIIGSNKSSNIQGFSKNNNEEEAKDSAAKQMTLHASEALLQAFPALME